MSDEPADSLRRELEAAAETVKTGLIPGVLREVIADVLDAIWPSVVAALEAARADERERIEKAIEAEPTGHPDPRAELALERFRNRAAALARGGV